LEQAELKKRLKKIGIIGAFFAPALLFYALNLRGALVFYALILSVVLVLMVLIQSGRGGGLASLGGLDTDSLFGTHSATPISKATYVIGVLLIVTCMLAARLGTIKREGETPQQPGMEMPIPSDMTPEQGSEAEPESPQPAGED